MFFSSDELAFLLEITKCHAPFAITIDKIPVNEAEQRALQAKEELVNKGFLKDDAITTEGMVFLRLWEAYCTAQHFVIINKCVIGIVEGRRCVVAMRHENGYEIAEGDAYLVLQGLLQSKKRICEEAKIVSRTVVKKIDDYETFRNRAIEFGENLLSVGIFDFSTGKNSERIFYWDEDCIYAFDPKKGEEIIVDAPFVRRYIFDGLGLKKEVFPDAKG